MKKNFPIRILHVVPSIGIVNGVANVIINWYRNINRKKVQFDFLAIYRRKNSFEKEIKEFGGNVFYINNGHNTLSTLCEAFRGSQALHSHISHLNLILFPSAHLMGVKNIFLHSHNPRYSDNKLKNKINECMIFFAKPFVTDRFACSIPAGDFMFGKKSYTLIKNAVDNEIFGFHPEKREKKREKLGVKDKFVIGTIGRLAVQKNHSFMLDVFKAVYEKNKNSILLIAGDGYLDGELKEKADLLGIKKKVLFLGARRDVDELYQAMDIFVLTSFFEGLPVCAVEAQTNGLPCLLSDTISQETSFYRTDYIPLEAGAQAWAKKILKLDTDINNRFIPKDIAEKNSFDINNVADQIEKFYIRFK